MTNKNYSEYTEAEFRSLVLDIFNGANKSEEENNNDVGEFNRIVGHPSSSDLIYYPENDINPTPESVVKEVMEWRAKNGMPGFKNA